MPLFDAHGRPCIIDLSCEGTKEFRNEPAFQNFKANWIKRYKVSELVERVWG